MLKPIFDLLKPILTILFMIIVIMYTPKILKEIATESKNYQDVAVVIKEADYDPAVVIPAGRYFSLLPSDYKVVVEYENKEYTLKSRSAYEKCKDKEGQVVVGILESREYIDGKTRYEIIEIK